MAKKNDEFKNLTKRQKDCLDLIESLGIYELRALARVFGDNSPTTLKRGDHIKIIMDKIISGEELRPIPLRQGRPYKELSNIDGILSELSVISGKDYSPKSAQSSFKTPSKIITFHQAKEDVLERRLMPIDVRGVLKEKGDGELYFQDIESDALVLVKKNFDARLQPGDYLTGRAVLMNDEGDYALDAVKAINFCSDKMYLPSSCTPASVTPTEKFDFRGQNILLGGRYVLKTAKLLDKAEALSVALQNLKKQGVVSLALVPNVMDEDAKSLQALPFDATFLLKYEQSPQDSYEKILSFLDCVDRLQNQGVRMAIFVEDVVTLASIADFAVQNSKNIPSRSSKAVELIKRLMLTAKACEDGQNCTLFCTLDDVDLADALYVSAVYKISKKIEL